MDKEFNFIDELFKLVKQSPESIEKQLDEYYKTAFLSAYEMDKYKDYLMQQKIMFKVYRNSKGKHKVVRK